MQRNIMKEMQCINLFSRTRLQGYTDTQEHEANLALIASISHKIGIAELIIRNKIDTLMCEKSLNWLENLPENLELKGDINIQSRDKLISIQNLWLKLVEHYKIHNQIFELKFLDNLDFKKYFKKNKTTFKSRHNRLLRHHKVTIILALLKLIRNRAFHFENLYKMNAKGPRLSVTICNHQGQKAIISIHPSKIKEFLNDIIASFDKDLIYYAEC